MISKINALRLKETTPNFYGICIIMSRIHFYKKVNFVKNVTRSCPDSDEILGVRWQDHVKNVDIRVDDTNWPAEHN